MSAPLVRTNSATAAPIPSGLSSWMKSVPRTVVSVGLGQVRMGLLPEAASGPSRPRARPDFGAAKRRPGRRRRSGHSARHAADTNVVRVLARSVPRPRPQFPCVSSALDRRAQVRVTQGWSACGERQCSERDDPHLRSPCHRPRSPPIVMAEDGLVVVRVLGHVVPFRWTCRCVP